MSFSQHFEKTKTTKIMKPISRSLSHITIGSTTLCVIGKQTTNRLGRRTKQTAFSSLPLAVFGVNCSQEEPLYLIRETPLDIAS